MIEPVSSFISITGWFSERPSVWLQRDFGTFQLDDTGVTAFLKSDGIFKTFNRLLCFASSMRLTKAPKNAIIATAVGKRHLPGTAVVAVVF